MSIELPLSVIIPVYNGAKTIIRCLDSLVAIPNAATAPVSYTHLDVYKRQALAIRSQASRLSRVTSLGWLKCVLSHIG